MASAGSGPSSSATGTPIAGPTMKTTARLTGTNRRSRMPSSHHPVSRSARRKAIALRHHLMAGRCGSGGRDLGQVRARERLAQAPPANCVGARRARFRIGYTLQPDAAVLAARIRERSSARRAHESRTRAASRAERNGRARPGIRSAPSGIDRRGVQRQAEPQVWLGGPGRGRIGTRRDTPEGVGRRDGPARAEHPQGRARHQPKPAPLAEELCEPPGAPPHGEQDR